jgi:hypothetical protein
VQLQALDPKPHYILMRDRFTQPTDAGGKFEFAALPPGRYLLGHNLFPESDVGFGDEVKPPATFYPGTSDRSAAVPIIVGEGTEHNGLHFALVW